MRKVDVLGGIGEVARLPIVKRKGSLQTCLQLQKTGKNMSTSSIGKFALRTGQSLAAALTLALFAGNAAAVRLDPDGHGQVLIYPYYTTRAGNQTVISVTNHSDRHKALFVAFREARNGRQTLTFNVYLAPYDTWSTTAFALDENGESANLISGDKSCTYPAFDERILPNGRRYVPFRTVGYIAPLDDAGPNTMDRAREGYVEIFETGTLVPGSPPADAISPNGLGAPVDCEELYTGFSSYWRTAPATYLTNPTGGLSGEAMVLNVGDGTVMAYSATALADFRTDPSDIPAGSRSSVVSHRAPAENTLGLDDALNDPLERFATAVVDLPSRRLELKYPAERGVDAVSAVLAADAADVNYVNDASLGATTDWVINFPTKPYYTDQAIVGATAIKPFTAVYPTTGSEASAAMYLPYALRDPSGRSVGVSAGSSANLELRYATQVIALAPSSGTVNATGRPLGSTLVSRLAPVAASAVKETGWMSLDLLRYSENGGQASRSLRVAEDGTAMLGLPMIGFTAINYINSNAAPGVLANYSLSKQQRRTQDCRRNTISCK